PGGIVEEKVRFINKHDEFWLLDIAGFRKDCINLCQQLQHKGGIELGSVLQISKPEYTDDTTAIRRLSHEVLNIERRFTEKGLCALLLQFNDLSDDCTGGRCADLAVFCLKCSLAVSGDILKHLLQVIEIEEGKFVVVAKLEYHGHDTLLGFIEIEHFGKEHRPKF